MIRPHLLSCRLAPSGLRSVRLPCPGAARCVFADARLKEVEVWRFYHDGVLQNKDVTSLDSLERFSKEISLVLLCSLPQRDGPIPG